MARRALQHPTFTSVALAATLSAFAATAAAAQPAPPPAPTTTAPATQDPPTDPPPATATPATTATPPADAPPPPPAASSGFVLQPSGAPASDSPQAAASEPANKPKIRHWEGSSLFNQNSITTSTIFRGQQLYADPTVESSLYILPRYAINESWQIRGRIIVSYEYTNSDTTQYRNEPQLSDTGLYLYYRGLPKVVGFQPYVAASLNLPTSKASQSHTLVASPGLLVQISRAFQHFLHGEARIIATLGYAHPLYESKNPETVDPRPPGSFACVGGNNCQDLLSGTLNTSDVLAYSMIVEAEWGKWSPALLYLGSSQWVYHPTPVLNPVDGTPVTSPSGFEPTSVKQVHYLSAFVDYNFNSWFTGEIGVSNSVLGINGAGERSNLFFDRYQDTRAYIGASIQLDNLARVLSGEDGGEGGVVRAKNDPKPSHPPIFKF